MGAQFTPMINFIGPERDLPHRRLLSAAPFPGRTRLRRARTLPQHQLPRICRSRAPESGKKGLLNAAFFVPADDLKRRAAAAKQNGRGLALVFEQAQCAGCIEMHEKSFADPKLVKLLSSKFDTVRIDTRGKRTLNALDGSAQKEEGIARAMGIRYTPTVVFFDASGKEIMCHKSYLRAEHFATLVAFLSNGTYLQYKSFQDWLRVKNAPRGG